MFYYYYANFFDKIICIIKQSGAICLHQNGEKWGKMVNYGLECYAARIFNFQFNTASAMLIGKRTVLIADAKFSKRFLRF